MRMFFLKIPKPLKQHPIEKKIIHSAIFKDLGEKLPEPSNKLSVYGGATHEHVNVDQTRGGSKGSRLHMGLVNSI